MEVSAVNARPAFNVPRLVALAVRLRVSESSYVLIANAGSLKSRSESSFRETTTSRQW